jgi:hypothetical protein
LSTVELEPQEANGHMPEADPIELAHDAELIRMLTGEVKSRESRIEELRAEIDQLTPALKRYQKALALLTGEDAPAPGRPKGARVRAKPSGVGDERLERVEAGIRDFAKDHDEFRQVDIRSTVEGISSSVAATAFETLRQRNVIRLARKDGNNKFYRLTAEALREGDDGR